MHEPVLRSEAKEKQNQSKHEHAETNSSMCSIISATKDSTRRNPKEQ